MFVRALKWFGEAPFPSHKRTIDVSGDGINNAGPALSPMRDILLANGITINGLPIALRRDQIDNFQSFNKKFITVYFEDCVVGGADSFVIPVDHYSQLETAIRIKLIREIAGFEPHITHASYRSNPRSLTDCTVVGQQPGR